MAKTPGNIRGARTIARIVDAAARLFGKEGYNGASMNAVAAAAGVSKGLLHYHFRSKEHLLIEAQRATFKQIHLRFDDRFAQGNRGMEHALEGLDALWQAVRDVRAWAPFVVETWSLAGDNEVVRNHLDEFYAEAMELLQNGIERAFEGQQLALPADRLANIVRVVLHGLVVGLAFAKDEDDVARVEQAYMDMREIFATVALEPKSSTG